VRRDRACRRHRRQASRSRADDGVTTEQIGDAAKSAWIAPLTIAQPTDSPEVIHGRPGNQKEITMFTTKFHTALIVTAVSVGTLAFATPAQGLTVKGSTTDVKVHFSKPQHDAILKVRSPEDHSTIQVIDAGEVVARIQAGATGQGDSDEECGHRADLMNIALDSMNLAAANNDWPAAGAFGEDFAYENEAALDAGCFVVYEPPID
jgi:hypothetical protein